MAASRCRPAPEVIAQSFAPSSGYSSRSDYDSEIGQFGAQSFEIQLFCEWILLENGTKRDDWNRLEDLTGVGGLESQGRVPEEEREVRFDVVGILWTWWRNSGTGGLDGVSFGGSS